MSRSGESTRKSTSGLGLGLDPDRLREALSLDGNKPDSRALPDLGSPVSPLRAAGPAHTSSSSSSSGSFTGKPAAAAASASGGGAGRRSHSGELSGSGENSPTASEGRSFRPGHRRSGSGPLIFSGGSGGGGSTASSPASNVLPAGNICPSGRIGKTGMAPRVAARSDVLGSGTGHYGHGSIMRGGGASVVSGTPRDSAPGSLSLQELTRAGNEHYKKGNYAEALRFYDRAVASCPDNASCRSNRAAALIGLGRPGEAAKECEEAVRFDPANARAHHRLATLNLRLGLIENARKHFALAGHGQHTDPAEWQKLQDVERHLGRLTDARKMADWKSALREADAAIAAGADSSPLLFASRVEALLRLHRLEEADSTLSSSPKLESSLPSSSYTKFFGMVTNSYIYIVQAQVDMALGRFEAAVAAAEKAKQIDPANMEVAMVVNNVRLVARARARGNELFKSANFEEAFIAYGEGLKYEPSNSVLYCNRAACWSKLGQWEKSVVDCNEALRWVECVRDYEVLRKELPGDTDVAEALFHAQVALKTSRGEEVSNMKFGGEVEEVTSVEQFQAATSVPGVSVVFFMATSNQQCSQVAPFVNTLCRRYPSANFLKVNINESPLVANAENVRIVPTFKIYKNGMRMKEMICPNQQVLEYSVRHYSL
ncbi:TPR repeat-containing thioredoxin TTL1 [Ananas comosus]|uniref:TPR repeat-containing thioredoxin TTL1 n=1 Tax=Ananas comosus TaxID=4615 RepID=A0A199W0L8_ANACO|nr:TPR repeat-containing thioredoxin TTL1 [Ananas comosus]